MIHQRESIEVDIIKVDTKKENPNIQKVIQIVLLVLKMLIGVKEGKRKSIKR